MTVNGSRSGTEITEATLDVDGVEVFLRRVEGDGTPTVFVHGNPTHSEDWLPFLEQVEGPAVALDLPGFGRSARPKDFDYTMHGYADFFERFLATAGIVEYKLVVHDWGVVALIAAQRQPRRLERLVIANAVPLMRGYRWHWVARIWRRRGLGGLFNAATTRSGVDLLLRRANATEGPMPPEFVDMVWRHLDRGTKRAILRLYRSADPEALAAAGSRLGEISAPALVVWGEHDPYIAPEFARRYAEILLHAEAVVIPDAGHWPWIDRPDTVDRIVGFLNGAPASR